MRRDCFINSETVSSHFIFKRICIFILFIGYTTGWTPFNQKKQVSLFRSS